MAYSFLRHVSRSVLSSGNKSAWIGMFSAYLDASGTKRKEVLTVAGFVSRVSKWERFDKEWAGILQSEGVGVFRMTDFVSSNADFRDWKGPANTERRRLFFDELVQCAKRHTNKGFSASLITKDYAEVNGEYMISEVFGPPYSICAGLCLAMIGKWAKNKEIPLGQVLVMVEDGDDDQGDFRTRARTLGVKVIPLTKQDANAFQVADLAGWKTRTAIEEALFRSIKTEEEANNVLRSLRKITPIVQEGGVLNKQAVLKMCADGGIPNREIGLAV